MSAHFGQNDPRALRGFFDLSTIDLKVIEYMDLIGEPHQADSSIHHRRARHILQEVIFQGQVSKTFSAADSSPEDKTIEALYRMGVLQATLLSSDDGRSLVYHFPTVLHNRYDANDSHCFPFQH